MYVIVISIYVDLTYNTTERNEGAFREPNEYEDVYIVLLVIGIAYPLCYDLIQMMKARSDYFKDPGNYVDITFASLTALWIQPEQFAAGIVPSARVDRANYPIQMGVDVERWTDQYPLAVALVERLCREERISG